VRAEALRLISDTVFELLAPDNLKMGEQIAVSKLYEAVEQVPGVKYLDVNRFQRVPFSRRIRTSLALPSDVKATDIIVGANTQDDVYSISFLNASQFKVTSSRHGVEPSFGTVGVPFIATLNSVTFTVSYSTQAPTAADYIEIKLGALVGNLDPDSDVKGKLFQSDFTLVLRGGRGSL
jgi:hypothetical protein